MTNTGETVTLLTWRDVDRAFDRLIDLAETTIDVAERDLALTGWEGKERSARLEQAMGERNVRIRIVLVDLTHVERHLARLTHLLRSHGTLLTVLEAARPSDVSQACTVVDGRHGLVRPDLVRSTGRLWVSNPYKSRPYREFFEHIWELGGRRFFPEAHGL